VCDSTLEKHAKQPNLGDRYDWVVLGDHPAALLSASLVAKQGLSVLMLPMGATLKASVSESGHFHDPESNFMMGLGRSGEFCGLVSDSLSRLGILPAEQELIRVSELPQLLTPETRLSFAPDLLPLSAEIKREFGADVAEKIGLPAAIQAAEREFHTFWLQLGDRMTLKAPAKNSGGVPRALRGVADAAGLGAARGAERGYAGNMTELRRILQRHPRFKLKAEANWLSSRKKVSELARELGRPDLAETLFGLGYALSGTYHVDPPVIDILQILALGRTGATFRGGMTNLRELLVRLAQRNGAHLLPALECRRVFVENGRLVGIQIANHGNMISVGGGVLGCTVGSAVELMALNGRNWLRRLKSAPVPAGWVFTLSLTVHAEAVPVGMGARAIWQEKGAPPLEVEVADVQDYGSRDRDLKIIFLRALMPFKQESLDPDFQRLTAARMLRQAMELLPFLEFHIVRVYPDFQEDAMPIGSVHAAGKSVQFGEVQQPRGVRVPRGSRVVVGEGDELASLYGFKQLSLIPENIRVFGEKGIGSRTGIEGLFAATGESYPELGSLGAVIAATEGVAWIAHRSGLPGPFAWEA